MSYSKEQRDKLVRVAGQMEAIINKCKREGNRGLTSDERERFDRLADEHSSLEASARAGERVEHLSTPANNRGIAEFGTIEEMRDTFRTSPGREKDKSPEARAFSKYLRGGLEAMDSDQRALLRFKSNTEGIQNAQTLTTTGGGYIVPTGFSGQLEEAKKWFGGIKGVVDIFKTESGNPWPWPTVNDTANRGRIIGVNTQVTETDLAFGQVTFNAYIGTSDLVLVPLALMEDAYFDLDGLVARLLGTRLGRLYNWKCTAGTGTNEPTGIVTAAVAAGATYGFASNSGAGVNGPAYTDLVEVEHTVDPAYRYNPATNWMFNDTTLKAIKKLVDGNGRPLWQPGLTASLREGAAVDFIASKPTILDHPYVINQDMPGPGASHNSVLFGDMNTFKVRELTAGTTVMRLVERYADYLQVGFIAFQRFDSNLIDAGTHPVAVGVNAAS